ncbi:cytochrome P450 [Jatrophihabitans sp. DSM 45814]
MSSSTGLDPLFDPVVVQDPYDYYRELRENDPVHEIEGTGTYLVTRADLIYDIVARPAVFSSDTGVFLHKGEWAHPGLRAPVSGDAPEGKGVLATADPPDHGRQRKIVSRKLSTSNMQAMEPEFRALVEEAMASASPDEPFEWMGRVAEPLPMVMVARILGLPDEVAPALKSAGYNSVERISGFVSEERIMQFDREMPLNMAEVVNAYATARQDPRAYSGSMIGMTAQAVAEGNLDDQEAFGIFGILIAAGGESTTSLTGTGVRILAEKPELQAQLREHPELIPAFVEEACRVDAPFRGHYRVLTEDANLAGRSLPAGSRLVLMWPAANRDESIYEEPDEVRLDRTNRYHVGFGWGIHLCVGAPLARVEARVAIETLLAKTRSFHIAPAGIPLQYHLSLMVRRLVTLPLLLDLKT